MDTLAFLFGFGVLVLALVLGQRRGHLALFGSLGWFVFVICCALAWPATGGLYQPVLKLRDNLPAWEKEWDFHGPLRRPLYEIIHPFAENKLPVAVERAGYQMWRETPWAYHVNARTSDKVEFPDGSILFLSRDFSEADRKYLTAVYWDQRWERWKVKFTPWIIWALLPLGAVLTFAFFRWFGRRFAEAVK